MSEYLGRVFNLARQQHDVVASWQMKKVLRLQQGQVNVVTRSMERVHRGVYRVEDGLTLLGELMAAVLALGPAAAISHLTGVMLLGMLDLEPGTIHVSVPRPGRAPREDILVHRRRLDLRIGTLRHGIPVMSATQCLRDADLERHELYRALDQADRLRLLIDRHSLPLGDVVDLQRAVRGRTRSLAEARFILLCHDHGLELPLVNHRLNGFEADFHWPRHRLVVEVDGYEFHKERPQFEEDRRRGIAHRIAGYEVIRASALQVQDVPGEVLAAVLAAAPLIRTRCCRSGAAAAAGRR